MLDSGVKIGRPSVVRNVGDCVVASLEEGIIVVRATSKLGQDLAVIAASTEAGTESLTMMVGEMSVGISRASAGEVAEIPPTTTSEAELLTPSPTPE